MKIETIRHIIPEHVVEDTIYISCDGKKFHDEQSCLKHEEHRRKQDELDSHLVFKSSKSILMYPDDKVAHLHFISSKEEHDFLLQNIGRCYYHSDNYLTKGPGWYILIINDMGDSVPTYDLLEVNSTIESLEKELKTWKYAIKYYIEEFNKVLVPCE